MSSSSDNHDSSHGKNETEMPRPTPVTGFDLGNIDFNKLAPMMTTLDQTIATSGAAPNLLPKEFSNRTYGQQLTYHAACFYLFGASFGTLNGVIQTRPKMMALPTNTLRLNALMNGVSTQAGNTANACGILGLMFVSYTHLFAWEAPRITAGHELAAAASAGATYNYGSQGVKGAARGAVIGSAVYGIYALAKYLVSQ